MSTINEIFNPEGRELSPGEIEGVIKKALAYEQFKEIANIRAQEEFYIKKERLKIKLRLNKNIPSYEYDEMEELIKQSKELKKNDDLKYAAFITINPKLNLIDDFEQLSKFVHKCLSKHWVNEYAYCYEQRSQDEENIHGLHVHILLTRHTKPSHLEREVRSTFNSIIGHPKHIDIKYKKKEWINDKLDYMSGKKTDEGKPEKVVVDKLMRQTLGIEDIYYSQMNPWIQENKNLTL